MENKTVLIHANLEISVKVLESLVNTAKNITGPDPHGHYRIDTADLLNRMISRFLVEKDFEGYVKDPTVYDPPSVQ